MPLKPIVVAAPTIGDWVAMLAAATLEGMAPLERGVDAVATAGTVPRRGGDSGL